MPRILVVDDEATLVETIRYNLRREGYEVSVALDGAQAIEVAHRARPDLVVLDVMLPKVDGFDVCRTLRRESTVPILMLTAKDDVVDKVVGLEIGADDYMTKPFSMRELLARVKAMLRRAQMAGEGASRGTEDDLPPLVSADLEIDLRQHRVTLAGSVLALAPREFDLLAFLVRNRGQVFSREVLLQRVWGYDYVGDTRTVDVHIRGLRGKIEANSSEPVRIETIRGVGYRFVG